MAVVYSSPLSSQPSHSTQIEATVGEAKKRLMGQLEGYSIHAKRQAETIRDKHNAKTEPKKREEL